MSDTMTVDHLSKLAVAHTTAIAGAVEALRGHAVILTTMTATIEAVDGTQQDAIRTFTEANDRLAGTIAVLGEALERLERRVATVERDTNNPTTQEMTR